MSTEARREIGRRSEAKRRLEQPEHVRQLRRDWHQRNPEKVFAARLGRYGITPERYEEMLASQNGGCAVCGELPGNKRLAVDHDHSCCPEQRKSCGKCVRGLLCDGCNMAIGKMKESAERLYRAAIYVEKKNEQAG